MLKVHFSKRNISRYVLVFIASALAFSFQNCGKGFQSQQLDLSSLKPSSLAIPQIVFTSPSDNVSSASVTVQFNILDVDVSSIKSVTCQLGANPTQDCSLKNITFTNLVDGDYSLKVSVTTNSDVKIEAVKVFRKDATAPVVSVSSAPSVVTNQVTANFIFAAVDVLSGIDKIECALDAATFAVCSSPQNFTGLKVGAHNLKIRASDKSGNISSVFVYNWSVDLSAPTVLISLTPTALTKSVKATFGFSGMGLVSYECQLDMAAYSTCVSPSYFADVGQGDHVFRVRGKNAAGTVSSAAIYSWKVDSMGPTTPVLTADVLALTNKKAAKISFIATDAGGIASYECSLNSEAFAICVSPASLSTLTEGKNSFQVRAKDTSGNLSLVGVFNWTIDATAPKVGFTEIPEDFNTNGVSSFKFVVTDTYSKILAVTCSWKTAITASMSIDCKSGAVSYQLPPGRYTLMVQTTDELGNSGTAIFKWEVDKALGELYKFKELAVNQYTKCGVTLDNRMLCMSNTGAPKYMAGLENLHNVVPVDYSGFCALTTISAIRCWNWSYDNIFTIFDNSKLSNVQMLSGGQTFTCAVLKDTSVWCWGKNNAGQLGNNSKVDSLDQPVQVIGLSNVKSVSASFQTACATTLDGRAKCWGDGGSGQLGNGSFMSTLIPVDVVGLSDAKEVKTSWRASCALMNSGTMKCWGDYAYIASEKNQTTNVPGDVVGLSNVQQFKVGSAILTDGSLKFWGMIDGYDAYSTLIFKPTDLGAFTSLKSFSEGNGNCVIQQDGGARCFGSNPMGDLGLNSTTQSSIPTESIILSNFKSIKGQNYSACGMTNNNTVKCWGYNFNSYLGSGDTMSSATPVAVSGLGTVKSLSVGIFNSCAITSADTVKCWGNNDWGSLGDGTKTLTNSAVDVIGVTNAKEVSGSCVLMFDGSVKCWGSNFLAGTPDYSGTPTTIAGLTGVKSISVAGHNACAINSVGKVYCWGLLENGHTISTLTEVIGVSDAVKISAGSEVRCALSSVGGVKCWGRNSLGGLGNGTTGTTNNDSEYFTSVDVIGLSSGVAKVEVGVNNACALKTNGTIFCWGANPSGALGNGSYNNTSVPVQLVNPKPVVDFSISQNTLYLIHDDNTVSTSGLKYFFYHEPAGLLRGL